MIDYLLNKLDVIVYVVIVVIVYMALLYLWRKIAQLETSFHKMESALANIVINQEKNSDVKPFNEFEFEVFNMKHQDVPITKEEIEPLQTSVNIEEIVDNVSEVPSNTTFTKSKLARMNVEQLKEQAERLGEDVDGTKQDLINRILSAQIIEKI